MLLYLIGLPTALVLGIVGNLLTPIVRNALVARSAKRRDKRIAEIRQHVKFVERLRAEPSAATAYLCRRVMAVVCIFTLTAAINAAALILVDNNATSTATTIAISLVALTALAVAVYDLKTAMDSCAEIYATKWYAARTKAQLRKVGVEPAGPSHPTARWRVSMWSSCRLSVKPGDVYRRKYSNPGVRHRPSPTRKASELHLSSSMWSGIMPDTVNNLLTVKRRDPSRYTYPRA
jgi:hypothetical protein